MGRRKSLVAQERRENSCPPLALRPLPRSRSTRCWNPSRYILSCDQSCEPSSDGSPLVRQLTACAELVTPSPSMATIHSLPPELLSRILELGPTELPHRYTFLRHAALVSSSWRDVAQEALWKRVELETAAAGEAFVASGHSGRRTTALFIHLRQAQRVTESRGPRPVRGLGEGPPADARARPNRAALLP